MAIAAALALPSGPARAQDAASMQVGRATVSIGGGTAILTLPDVEFVKVLDATGANVIGGVKNADDFGDEIGWNIGGSVSVPMTGAQGRPKWLTLSGFWASIEDDDSSGCSVTATTGCAIIPLFDASAAATATLAAPVGILDNQIGIRSEREVDHWGVSLESRWLLSGGDSYKGGPAANARYFALGADVRGIDQDLDLRITSAAVLVTPLTYDETLETRYYGAYAAWGGDYTPFLFRGLWQRWGLQSSFALRGGVYYADTDYSGRIFDPTNTITAATGANLSLSTDDVAFIGGIVLETRKRIGERATLSLRSEYEYYSWVPDMNYNDTDVGPIGRAGPNVGTSIGDDDAFSARTMLRLTVSLGGEAAK